MSYCRWSCMDFRCELYIYTSAEGYTIHLCDTRITYESEPPPQPFLMFLDQSFDQGKYLDAKAVYDDFIKKAIKTPIDLPYAGETILVGDAQTMFDKLVELKALGYIFPDYVLDEIELEAIEEAAQEAMDEMKFKAEQEKLGKKLKEMFDE